MLWIVALLMCCLQTVESYGCSKSNIIVGRLGKELVLNFTLSDLRDEYNKYITERGIVEHERRKIFINETNIQELKKESDIRFENEIDSTTGQIIFIDGNPTDRSADSRTEIFLTNDAFVVKKTKLQKEDAGIYLIEFRSVRLGQKVLIIAGKPTINGTSPPNPVLKAEDNYSTILQLECHSVSTSIGDCQLYNSMYIMWYKNGMRMTELDPTLSQINVTVDHNGGKFTCLATEYPPCYHRLQTTKHYDDVLNIEECDNVYENETFIVKPQYGPIDVKLEPDQREITVNKNDDLKVRCSAKCQPKCEAKWEKNYQDLKSRDLVTITESMFGSELKIVNINSSDEGVYSCLVNNTHGEAKKNFTLRVNPTTVIDTTQSVTSTTINNLTKYETGNNLISAEMNTVIVAVTVVIVIIVFVIVIVIIVIMYKRYHKENTVYHNAVPTESSEEEEDEGIFETMNLYGGAPLIRTSRDNNNLRNGGQNRRPENIKYAELDLHTPDGFRIHGTKRKPEVLYSTIDFTKKAPPMPINIELDSDDDEWS